jgi:dienelactone hydrolase
MPAQAETKAMIQVPAGDGLLGAELLLPRRTSALVVLAHGSGDLRAQRRALEVAEGLLERDVGSLVIDVLRSEETDDDVTPSDVVLLAERVEAALDTLAAEGRLAGQATAVLGVGPAAAAALQVAADKPDRVAAVVACGGHPDRADLAAVQCPVLLLAGGEDHQGVVRHRAARDQLGHHAITEVVLGAGPRFEEGTTLEQAATIASDWLARTLDG